MDFVFRVAVLHALSLLGRPACRDDVVRLCLGVGDMRFADLFAQLHEGVNEGLMTPEPYELTAAGRLVLEQFADRLPQEVAREQGELLVRFGLAPREARSVQFCPRPGGWECHLCLFDPPGHYREVVNLPDRAQALALGEEWVKGV